MLCTQERRLLLVHLLLTHVDVREHAYKCVSYSALILSRPAKVTPYWAFAGLGSKVPANVCHWYQKAGLGA